VKDANLRYGTQLRRTIFAALAGICVIVFVFALYLRTLAPTVLYYHRPLLLDSVMLQVQAIVLGIPGGTGSPTWAMLTHLFTYLPFGDLAYRTNLASAVYAAIAVLLIYVAGLLLSRRMVAAAASALAFGLGTSFWSVAVITEVYDLNVLLIMLVLIALLLWRERRKDRCLLLAAFLMGFALTDHLTSALVIPAGFLFVGLVDWHKLVDWRLALKGSGLFLLGIIPYLYLPIRASMNPPLNEWDPTTFGRFWYLVSGGGHQGNMFAFGPAELPGRLMLYGYHLFDNFHWSLVMIGMTGVAVLFFRDRATTLLLGFLFVGWLFYALEYQIFDVELYYITTYMVLALWMAVGFGATLEALEDAAKRFSRITQGRAVFAVSAVMVLLPLIGVGKTYAENDMSNDYRGQQTIDAVAENTAPNATVLHHRSELWYMVLVEKRRRDLTLIDPWLPGRSRYTDIVWPDDIDHITTNLRYGTNDTTGVSTAKEMAKKGPVYILNEQSAEPHNFYEAGFKTHHVEGDLWELVPPGGKPYTEK